MSRSKIISVIIIGADLVAIGLSWVRDIIPEIFREGTHSYAQISFSGVVLEELIS